MRMRALVYSLAGCAAALAVTWEVGQAAAPPRAAPAAPSAPPPAARARDAGGHPERPWLHRPRARDDRASGPSGTFAGSTAQTAYGPMQVAIVVKAGRITHVKPLHLHPNQGGRSVAISAGAVPILRTEALHAQSAKIDAVSGATYTSEGYRTSLQSATSTRRTRDPARAGTPAPPQVNSSAPGPRSGPSRANKRQPRRVLSGPAQRPAPELRLERLLTARILPIPHLSRSRSSSIRTSPRPKAEEAPRVRGLNLGIAAPRLAGQPIEGADMDITQVILDDHAEQRRLFAALEDIGPGDPAVLAACGTACGPCSTPMRRRRSNRRPGPARARASDRRRGRGRGDRGRGPRPQRDPRRRRGGRGPAARHGCVVRGAREGQ